MLAQEETAATPLKQAVAERLALHRAKTGRQQQEQSEPQTGPQTGPARSGRSAKVQAAVAERYARAVSYREFLENEAERALREAETAVAMAQRSAEAVTVAQRQLLTQLEHWNADGMLGSAAPDAQPMIEMQPEPVMKPERIMPPEPSAFEIAEAQALDDEILFRSAPEFAPAETLPLTANLIEFPRQLVASRKARPRLAEGPLLAEAEARGEASQLRIFEVEASPLPAVESVETVLPEWSSLVLEAQVTTPVEAPAGQTSLSMLPQTAPIGLRLMAAIVDGCMVLAASLVFIAGFAMSVHTLPMGRTAVVGLAVLLGVLVALYQAFFFTFSDATPGMRYARIGLCTFSDENPTRSAMRKRALAMMLSAAPIGLGFLWAWLDEDGLSWHDRITRMYQRSY